MKYNWLQALEMVANGQPMHLAEEDTVYLVLTENSMTWKYKNNDGHCKNLLITPWLTTAKFKPYNKQIELDDDEKVILRNVDGVYKYICRDKSNELFLYEHKPTKKENIWAPTGRIMRTFGQFNHLFQGIKWEDAEPRLIADLIK